MKRLLTATIALLFLVPVFAASIEENSNGVDRYAIYIGSNKGGKGRETLLYAGSDAQNFQKAMSEIGGVNDSNSFILIDPTKEKIDETLNTVSQKITQSQSHAKRSEFIFYYSGHSDETALLLGDIPYDYSSLKAAISDVPSDIHVVILDSCYSGNFIRTKGGQKRKPFLVDDSSVVTGHAYLSSSSTNEYSQESDEIESSYFTNAMITGLRGAADTSGDNKVTLNELYSYAFNDTLSKTEDSKAGPQHPNFNITLVGSGDLVLSDISSGEAMLSLSKDAKGKFIIRNAEGKLISEINKTAGQPIFMALPAAQYSAVIIDEYSTKQGYFTLNKDQIYVLDQNSLSTINRKSNRVRGDVKEDEDDGEFLSIDDLGDFGKAEEETPESRGSRRRYNSSSDDSSSDELSFGEVEEPEEDEDLEDDIDLFDRDHMSIINFSLVPGLSFLGGADNSTLFSFGIFGTFDYNVLALQYSGIGNITAGTVNGAQVSGLFNMARDVNGAQVTGLFNIADNLNGDQVSGLFNIADAVNGIQLSGLFNVADSVNGVQTTGLINIAREVHGAQVGVINVADTSEGIALGVINIIHDGMHHLAFNWDTNDMFDYCFQSGTKHLFMTIGYQIDRKDFFNDDKSSDDKSYVFYGGFGTEFRFGYASLDFEVLSKYVYNWNAMPKTKKEVESFDFGDLYIPSWRVTLNALSTYHFDLSIGFSMDVRNVGSNDLAFKLTNHKWEIGDTNDGTMVYPSAFFGFKIK